MTPQIHQRFVVTAYGRTIAIERDDDSVQLPFLPFAWQNDPPMLPIDRSYTVTHTGDTSWDVSIGEGVPLTLISSEAVTEHVEGDLHHWLATYTQGFLFVHAGCVSWRNLAIVIPGRSYAGKTTLTQALLEAGATYYSDDYAIIDPTGAIHPFPRLLRVRHQQQRPSARIDPAQSNWPIGREPVRAGVVAALTYDAEAGWAVESLTSGSGALALLDNTVAARERPQDALRMMSIAMHGAIAIKGTRDDAATSAIRLIGMVDELIDGEK